MVTIAIAAKITFSSTVIIRIEKTQLWQILCKSFSGIISFKSSQYNSVMISFLQGADQSFWTGGGSDLATPTELVNS